MDDSCCNNISPESSGLPLDWYSNTILACFEEIEKNKNYEKINYNDLLLSLEKEISNSINKYNF